MTLPNTEIIIFPSTEAFRSDPDVLIDGLGPLSKTEGLLRYVICQEYSDYQLIVAFEALTLGCSCRTPALVT